MPTSAQLYTTQIWLEKDGYVVEQNYSFLKLLNCMTMTTDRNYEGHFSIFQY